MGRLDIYIHEWMVWIYGKLAGKYSSHMEPMGKETGLPNAKTIGKLWINVMYILDLPPTQ